MTKLRICEHCKKDIPQKELPNSVYNKRIFCSVSCVAKSRTGTKNSFYGRKHTEDTKRKIRNATKKQFKNGMPEETRLKISKKNKGRRPHYKKLTKEQINKRNKAVKSAISKDKHWNWKGGISPLMMSIRKSDHYKRWRKQVYERDNFKCVGCGESISGNLNAHHKIPFYDIIEKYNITSLEDAYKCQELWDINNGETLCKDCHKGNHISNNTNTTVGMYSFVNCDTVGGLYYGVPATKKEKKKNGTTQR